MLSTLHTFNGLSLAVFGILLVLSGCNHYQLGPPEEVAYESIYITPIEVFEIIPQAQALITENLREAFLQSGRISLQNRDSADVILDVVLVDLTRETGALQQFDTGRTASTILTLHAEASLIERRTGRRLMQKIPLQAQTVALNQAGLVQAEYQAIPILAETLARKVRDQVLFPWSATED